MVTRRTTRDDMGTRTPSSRPESNPRLQLEGNMASASSPTSSNPLPASLYESLLPKLVTVLELTQNSEGTATPQAKQALLQATNDFKNALNQARELAINLPGGELRIEEQDEIIEMLVKLRDRKREQLAQFSARTIASTSVSTMEVKMEVDSMASTPYHE